MSRSIKKGPHIDERLFKKVMKMMEAGDKKIIKTWARSSDIPPEFVGFTFAVHNGQRVQISRVAIVDDAGVLGIKTVPGTVVRADKSGVFVACGGGALRLEEVRPAGRKSMPAAAWVAGRGIAMDDRFEPCEPK